MTNRQRVADKILTRNERRTLSGGVMPVVMLPSKNLGDGQILLSAPPFSDGIYTPIRMTMLVQIRDSDCILTAPRPVPAAMADDLMLQGGAPWLMGSTAWLDYAQQASTALLAVGRSLVVALEDVED